MKNILTNKYIIRFLFPLFVIGIISPLAYSQSDSSKIAISGFVDTYFSENFNNPADHTSQYRVFDGLENQFNLNLAKIVLQKTAAPVGFRIDLAYGPAIDIVNSDAALGPAKSLKNVEDAYLTAIVPVGNGLTVNAGKLVTHLGGEVIETPGNINYSRSILFGYAIPFDHYGVSVSYPFTSQLTINGYLYNGWGNYVDVNSDKTFGAEVAYSPLSSLSVIINYINGAEEPNSTNKREVFDGIINYQITDAFMLSINGDYGQETITPSNVAIWEGVSGILKYSFDPTNYLALRAETYSDPDAFTTGIVQQLHEFTLTYEHDFTSDFLLRLEYRTDGSNQPVFEDNTGLYTKKQQSTLSAGAVYSF
jgi:Putative beta-barrel porin-2, OmpL-like. bbp2